MFCHLICFPYFNFISWLEFLLPKWLKQRQEIKISLSSKAGQLKRKKKDHNKMSKLKKIWYNAFERNV